MKVPRPSLHTPSLEQGTDAQSSIFSSHSSPGVKGLEIRLQFTELSRDPDLKGVITGYHLIGRFTLHYFIRFDKVSLLLLLLLLVNSYI